jgi:hypothetical protein
MEVKVQKSSKEVRGAESGDVVVGPGDMGLLGVHPPTSSLPPAGRHEPEAV